MTSTKTKKDVVEAEVKSVSLILRPRITEKASMQSNVNAYTFVVAPNADKLNLAKEIKTKFKVSPLKINITNLPSKKVFVRGRWGVKAGLKKAVVFLKEGDTIKF